ncbi:MAG: prephenate dehydratase [Flavobacteriaceae bacterium]|nr:prephenate dehydratase [Flavobacteriaceae bacterium]
MKKLIAIQGIIGSFHHEVAVRYFNEKFSLIECLTFDKLVEKIVKGDADQAVMAIENSIAGSILPNYALIDKFHLQIIGEYNLNINHNLMAISGQEISDLKEVHSHPMALLQCKDFFHNYNHISLIESDDTAEVARRISSEKLINVGAIGSKNAAKYFGLNILANSIQTIKKNVTRFVIIQKNKSSISKNTINKSSLKFILDHKRGSLAAVLNTFSDCRLNLTKIQSLPIIDIPGKYAFFVDLTFDSFQNYEKACSILEIMAQEFKILGEYLNNK